MNVKEIRELILLMNENNLDELEIEREGTRVKLRKKREGIESSIAYSNGPASVAQVLPGPGVNGAKLEEKISSNLIEIKSPMVGTFYRAPSPDSAPFADVGQSVKKGDVVCIIEAMKLMNEIKAEVSGKIKEILVENGKPVEFGQALFLVEP